MKYYLHDSNSFSDEKISELYIEFGYEGLGLFYTILEKLAAQEKPIKTIVLKKQLNVGKKLEKCWLFMESIELIHSNNGETFNKQLLNFSEKYQIKKQKNTERISQWRENQEVEKNVTHYEHVRNTPKVKESKVKESKVKESKVKESKVNESKENNKELLLKKEAKFNYRKSLEQLVPDEKLVRDYCEMRKQKKAPTSETAFNLLVEECMKNNFSLSAALRICIEKNWQGFKVAWLNKEYPGQQTGDIAKNYHSKM